MATDTIMPHVRPGEILLTKLLEPLGVSEYQLAEAVDVPARRIKSRSSMGGAASKQIGPCGSPATQARRSGSDMET